MTNRHSFRLRPGMRRGLRRDYLSRIKMAYLEDGAAPSHRWYGWVAG